MSHNIMVSPEDEYLLLIYSYYISPNGYVMLYNNKPKRLVYLHRRILLPTEGYIVDHINGNKLDNRRSNLRIATRSQNNINSKSHTKKDGLSRGVYYHSNRAKPYQVKFRWNGVTVSYGYYSTVEAAEAAYIEGTRSYNQLFSFHSSRSVS